MALSKSKLCNILHVEWRVQREQKHEFAAGACIYHVDADYASVTRCVAAEALRSFEASKVKLGATLAAQQIVCPVMVQIQQRALQHSRKKRQDR